MENTNGNPSTVNDALAALGALAAEAAKPESQIPSAPLRQALTAVAGPDAELFAAGVMTNSTYFAGNKEARTYGQNSSLVAVDYQLDLTGEFARMRTIPVNRANIGLQAEGPGAHPLSGKLNKGDQITFIAKGNAYDVKGNGIGAIDGLVKSTISLSLKTASNTTKNVFVGDADYNKGKEKGANRAMAAVAGAFKAFIGA